MNIIHIDTQFEQNSSRCGQRAIMRHLLGVFRRRKNNQFRPIIQLAHYKPRKPQPPPSPPLPPRPPKKPETVSFNGESWEDPYTWMSKLTDKVAMRHMDVYMEQEEKYTEAVMYDTERLQSKLLSEMASRSSFQLSTPPLRWGPWLYYRRVEEGKKYTVLCRRLARLNEEFVSYKSASAGFDFTTGKKIEQKLVDYNQEAERFGGYAYEELSEISPDHRYLAYTMYDKEIQYFRLCVRDLNLGVLCNKPQADGVSSIAWAKSGQALLYVVTDESMRPYRIYCSMIGSNEAGVLLLEELQENVHLSLRHTKDFQFVTVNSFSSKSSKVFLINAADPLSDMILIWECEGQAHCIIEHHQGYLYLFTDAARDGQPVENHYLLRSPVDLSHGPRIWENLFTEDKEFVIEDVDFCDSHMVLIVREGRKFRLCKISLPLPNGKEYGQLKLKKLNPEFLPLPENVCQILPGPNYDYHSSTMRFTICSPVMPDAVVDYDLLKREFDIVQQQDLLHERTRILYGSASVHENSSPSGNKSFLNGHSNENDDLWKDMSEYYACELHEVHSYDGALVPLTVVYSRHRKRADQSPGLLHGHGAYGEILDKRWRNELKSLLDRGWVIAYADVRGGGGLGKQWRQDGQGAKRFKSVEDYISCARFLLDRQIVQENKLAGWGFSAGGLLVASAINKSPNLFRAAVLKVPFLDPTSTLLDPILPLIFADYEEFGYPSDPEDFRAIRQYSPYDNIPYNVVYPSVLVASSFTTRFGVWEAAKWVARVRERTTYDPKRPVLLHLDTDRVEGNIYLHCKESALEAAFLLKVMDQ